VTDLRIATARTDQRIPVNQCRKSQSPERK
jgi:hypothetical protein